MSFKIIHNRKKCTGCKSCTQIDENNWRMSSDAKSELLDEKKRRCSERVLNDEEYEKSLDCAYSCRVNIIHIVKDNKKII